MDERNYSNIGFSTNESNFVEEDEEIIELIDAITADEDELEEADVDLTDMLLTTEQEELEDVIEPAGNLLAMRFGVPQQISIWIWNGYDYFINDMDFELQDVLRRRPVRER